MKKALSMKKKSLRSQGIRNLLMPLPMLFVTSFWGLYLWGCLIYFSDHFPGNPFWDIQHPFWSAVMFLPLLIPLISCILGIVQGCLHLKNDKDAKICLILSIAGIVHEVGLLALCGYLGSIM